MQTRQFTSLSRADSHILHGKIWQPDAPKAIIALVHGLGEHIGRYENFAADLCQCGIAVCAADLHGHGKTRGPRGLAESADVLCGDIETIIDKAQSSFPKTPLILMGHSMGGGLALKYALDHKDLAIKAVIAQAPLIMPTKSVPAILLSLFKIITKFKPNARVQSRFKGPDISTLPEQGKAYEDDPLNHGYLGLKLGQSLFDNGEDCAARSDQFSYPLLITHGTQDVLTSYEASALFASIAPNARHIAYEDSAHEVHHDLHSAKVVSDISAFVAAHI